MREGRTPWLLAAGFLVAYSGALVLVDAARFLRESFLRGGKACRTMVAMPSLDAVFIDPALAWLKLRKRNLGPILDANGFPNASYPLYKPATTVLDDRLQMGFRQKPHAAVLDKDVVEILRDVPLRKPRLHPREI